MRAEALFCQGRFTDAHIELERAYAQVRDNGQINMALCCDFLSRRLSLYTDVEQRYTFAERYAELLQYHDASWINIWSATSAYYHALRGEADRDPGDFFAAQALHRQYACAGQAHDGNDRKSGVSCPGRLCQGGRTQRRTAGGVRGDALRAGGAAYPHPDGGGLRDNWARPRRPVHGCGRRLPTRNRTAL